jgi:hypothetical protein
VILAGGIWSEEVCEGTDSKWTTGPTWYLENLPVGILSSLSTKTLLPQHGTTVTSSRVARTVKAACSPSLTFTAKEYRPAVNVTKPFFLCRDEMDK